MFLNTPSALLTDYYQLTMAYGYWSQGIAEKQAVFQLYFRKNPFGGQYAVACGLFHVIEMLENYRFSAEDIEYLRDRVDSDTHARVFSDAFLDYLSQLSFSCDVDAVEEGELVFANEPLLRIRGPLLQCQLLETVLINLLNYATLVATKASRVRAAAQGDVVLDFGLRRAQGPGAALIASRACYLAGIDATSNTLAGSCYGVPVQGTMSHSWVMAFEDELESFLAYSTVWPGCPVLLIDTYDTLSGIEKALETGEMLRSKGHDLAAVRLDSGNMLELSCEVRLRLDAAGFSATRIVASGDLDEYAIATLKSQGAPIDMWGVGTKLMTCDDQPSLGMVYKLGAIADDLGGWRYTLKRSDRVGKETSPGIQQVRRYMLSDIIVQDVLYDELLGIDGVLPDNVDRYRDLLVAVFRGGECVYVAPKLEASRDKAKVLLKAFDQEGQQPVVSSLEPRLEQEKKRLLLWGGKK